LETRVLDQQIDTNTSGSRALFGMFAVFAEFERAISEERRTEGMRRYHAKLAAQGRKPADRCRSGQEAPEPTACSFGTSWRG
jgi:DNA invertase Pin-like site-specific DNA recombinase